MKVPTSARMDVAKGAMRPRPAAIGLVVAAGTLSAALGLYGLRHGIRLTPDGWAYWEGSVSLLRGCGYLYYGGKSIVLYPPLFSIYLAIVQAITGVSGASLALAISLLAGFSAASWTALHLLLAPRNARIDLVFGVCLQAFRKPVDHLFHGPSRLLRRRVARGSRRCRCAGGGARTIHEQRRRRAENEVQSEGSYGHHNRDDDGHRRVCFAAFVFGRRGGVGASEQLDFELPAGLLVSFGVELSIAMCPRELRAPVPIDGNVGFLAPDACASPPPEKRRHDERQGRAQHDDHYNPENEQLRFSF